MAGPISTMYGHRFHHLDYIDLAIEQAILMIHKTKDPKTGLLYHAWDCSRKADWANPITGLSPEFWGRSIGWVPMAILNELDDIPKEHPQRQELVELVRQLLLAICNYQSGDGRWYQVVDKGNMPGNWLETSCSCLFVAAISKAVRLEILEPSYLEIAERGYQSVVSHLEWKGEDLLIGGVCVGTGVGDYKHYCNRPTSVNDLHGVGAFLIMCTEIEQINSTLKK